MISTAKEGKNLNREFKENIVFIDPTKIHRH